MILQQLLPEQRFNELQTLYRDTTGLNVIAADINGTRVYGATPGSPGMQLGIMEALHACDRDWLQHAVTNSFQWGEAYFSITPLGLVAFAVPLSYNGQQQGALVSGFVILPEMADDYPGELRENLRRLDISVTPAALRALDIPVMDKTAMKQAAETLLNLSIEHGLNDLAELSEKRWRYRQQVHIAHYMEYMKTARHDPARIIIDRQSEIFQRIRQRDFNGAREILNEFLGAIFIVSGTRLPTLKVRIMELAVVISRSAVDAGVDAAGLLKLNDHYLPQLLAAGSFEDLSTGVARMLEEFIRVVAAARIKKKNLNIRNMIEFVNETFTRKITADEVAAAGGLSTSRALHLFKEETGLSLSEYVRKCRIDYAKYLMAHTDSTLADIALSAGFFDQSHFTRQFKAQENTTPRAYQQALQRLTEAARRSV